MENSSGTLMTISMIRDYIYIKDGETGEEFNDKNPKLQVNTIIGLDAHSTCDLIRLAKMAEEYKNEK